MKNSRRHHHHRLHRHWRYWKLSLWILMTHSSTPQTDFLDTLSSCLCGCVPLGWWVKTEKLMHMFNMNQFSSFSFDWQTESVRKLFNLFLQTWKNIKGISIFDRKIFSEKKKKVIVLIHFYLSSNFKWKRKVKSL